MPLTGPALMQRFQALNEFLVAHQQLWRPRPFVHLQLPWEAEHAELGAWLRQRTLADAEAAHNQPERLVGAPQPFPQLAQRSGQLADVGELPRQAMDTRPPRYALDVPGRKYRQIEAFASRLRFARKPRHWLDWCAGKGHLGHWLAHEGTALTCLERDPALVAAGQHLSLRLDLDARHSEQDVMHDSVARRLQAEHTPIALHACGDLHIQLLQRASATGCQQLAIAPCCYNRIGTDRYQPLSRAARDSTLQLSRDDLGLPLSETVTSGTRIRQQRDRSMAQRLAFDLLQRQIRGVDSYLPTPSLASAWLSVPFADYCRHLATIKELDIPAGVDWQRLEHSGWQRLAAIRNLELLRGLFRRPLELWLLLDQALYLAEQGFDVQLGHFCEHDLTPRNLMLLAERGPVDKSVENS